MSKIQKLIMDADAARRAAADVEDLLLPDVLDDVEAPTMSTQLCPGCGSPDVLPGRVYCRPTCKARHELQQAQREPRLPLLSDADILQTELPDEPQPKIPRPVAKEIRATGALQYEPPVSAHAPRGGDDPPPALRARQSRVAFARVASNSNRRS